MQTDPKPTVGNAGDAEKPSASQVIELFYDRIYAFLRRLTGNDSDAADLTQRTFARVWQALPGFAGRSSVGSWVHSIAYHTYVDWRRSNHAPESRPPEWWADLVCGGPQPDETTARNDLAARLYGAVDNLAPELRDTVHLHYYQELTLQETGDAMSVATSTVKYRLRQALTELEGKMGSERTTAKSPANQRAI